MSTLTIAELQARAAKAGVHVVAAGTMPAATLTPQAPAKPAKAPKAPKPERKPQYAMPDGTKGAVTVYFAFERETKRTFRFQELGPDSKPVDIIDAVVGTVYVKREVFGDKAPQAIALSIQAL